MSQNDKVMGETLTDQQSGQLHRDLPHLLVTRQDVSEVCQIIIWCGFTSQFRVQVPDKVTTLEAHIFTNYEKKYIYCERKPISSSINDELITVGLDMIVTVLFHQKKI